MSFQFKISDTTTGPNPDRVNPQKWCILGFQISLVDNMHIPYERVIVKSIDNILSYQELLIFFSCRLF
jgi:hypothetical protein